MPNDPLPLPNNAATPREHADDEAREAPVAKSERGRALLTEYASHHTETQKLIATIARLKSTTLEPPPSVPALADLALAIQQIEALLAANVSPGPDVYFAVELIQDVAMALRQRDVDVALCDGLDAAIREIGDTVVRQDAAAARVASAAALLRELQLRVDEMIRAGAAPAPSPVGDEDLPSPVGQRPDDAEARSSPGAGAGNALNENENVGIVLDPLTPAHRPLLETRTEPTTAEVPAALLPVPSPIEETRAAARVPEVTPVSRRDAANPIAHAPPEDPLAVLQSLSEEELLALFS